MQRVRRSFMAREDQGSPFSVLSSPSLPVSGAAVSVRSTSPSLRAQHVSQSSAWPSPRLRHGGSPSGVRWPVRAGGIPPRTFMRSRSHSIPITPSRRAPTWPGVGRLMGWGTAHAARGPAPRLRACLLLTELTPNHAAIFLSISDQSFPVGMAKTHFPPLARSQSSPIIRFSSASE